MDLSAKSLGVYMRNSCFPAGRLFRVLAVSLLMPGSALLSQSASASTNEIWTDRPAVVISSDVQAKSSASETYFRGLAADTSALKAVLASAPAENTSTEGVGISLPMPNGGFQQFEIEQFSVLAPELARQFPEIKTYRGRGVDNTSATVYLDITPQGFHAMMVTQEGTVFIDPETTGENVYRSYYRRDLYHSLQAKGETPRFSCGVGSDEQATLSSLANKPGDSLLAARSGSQQRIYRLAVAATGEYTQKFGGTVAGALAAITTAINRVNSVFERDLSISLQLVANNQNIIYTNGFTDPYTNNNGSLILDENQANLDAVIGNANYDIGHVFATQTAGLAYVGSACSSTTKAKGTTGVSNPTGDAFYIDYVAHEIGHQLGANHSFNGTAGACGGGNRNSATAYEPGSGSSIMAYSGLCSVEDLQYYADATFHAGSIAEILQYTTSGTGSQCPQSSLTGNTPPTANAGADVSIPKGTPFTLVGTATDPDVQTLTYQWDQMDAGTATDANTFGTDLGDNALFRSFLPQDSASRTFPRLADVLSGTVDKSETLPVTNRSMNFRLTVRDNDGGVDEDDLRVTVVASAGPFSMVQPTTALTLDNTQPQMILWNVENTHLSPVSCSHVDILLSTDGGNTFTSTLVAGTSNDGGESINLPAVDSTTARIKVACSDNVFFAISDVDFEIATGSGIALTGSSPALPDPDTSGGGGGGLISIYYLSLLAGLGLLYRRRFHSAQG